MIEALHDLAEYVEQKRSDCVISWDVTNGELNISVAPSNIASFVEFLGPTVGVSSLHWWI